ncbi:hypothetical protein N836_09150 [Leptolyngbya sp. Heron Island J]|uniref:hypothetical protein n=1 Tax=Leptolyngbya sp. Heron Island J TaxID=1385935 RepID=UPI0003B94EAF|nr:hypothetical protein [Leptolyngbya sp. Heron Island J]ESA35978.1 hypothetical protein N836_09150 [Leptolyngbya sp. Heron Island J]
MKPLHSITTCLTSFTLLMGTVVGWSYPAQATALTPPTIPTTELAALKASPGFSDADYATASSLVQAGFDAALSSGEVEQAFEKWLDAMIPELADEIRNSPAMPAFVAIFESFGDWQSYEMLGTISLTSSETPFRTQLVYVKVLTESRPIFWQFLVLEDSEGWKIAGFNGHENRDEIIQDLFLMMLDIEK